MTTPITALTDKQLEGLIGRLWMLTSQLDEQQVRALGVAIRPLEAAAEAREAVIQQAEAEAFHGGHHVWISFDQLNVKHPFAVACSCFGLVEGLPPSVDLDAAKRQVREHLAEHGADLRDVEVDG